MTKNSSSNPFHEGEILAQTRAGVGDVAKWADGFIRDYLPEQHRVFHTALPFLVISGEDDSGKTWVTMVDGTEGFVTSPDPRSIALNTQVDPTDPLEKTFQNGNDIGVLGIELSSRRRNRFSGVMSAGKCGYIIDVKQTFGNCPQYINERSWVRTTKDDAINAQRSITLTAPQVELIRSADTMFIGSGHQAQEGAISNGFDASHRGGVPGFVHVVDSTHLQIPDYAGNNFFNTIGNLVSDPRIGLLFVDFQTGGLLHISGWAEIDWEPHYPHDPGALRVINIEIDEVLQRPGAVGLRWAKEEHSSRRLKLKRREIESENITSFYFEPIDGRPLERFLAGQHLPIEVQIPGQSGTSKRSYSLSGAPDNRGQYRISVKRENKGLVSNFLHDRLQLGSLVEAKNPSGDFVIPCSHCPLVLVSAGIGLTPMLSMLHANGQQQERTVWYVHGARNSEDHALRNEVDFLVSGNPNLHSLTYYSRPLPSDVLNSDYDREGRITADRLLEINAGPEARYMLCGPMNFLADIRNGLEARGVSTDHIYFEAFGSAG